MAGSGSSNIYYVYLHRKETTGEVFYVGKGKDDRAYKLIGRNRWWKNIVKKHGYTVEFVCKDISEEQAVLEEKRLIAQYGRLDLGTGCLCEKASDRRCTMTPQMTYLTNTVSKHVGSKARLKGDWMPGWLFSALEVASAFVTPLGYQCHLISVKSLIVRLLGKESQLAPTILARRDPGNPWFLWLAGKTDEATKLLLELDAEPGQGHQWCWERDSAEKAWKDSMGWDILFLCNLLMEDDNNA